MNNNARMDSLLSEQESEKVEIYLSIKSSGFASAIIHIYLQEPNKPKKKVQQSKTTQAYNQKIDFAEILTI